MLTCATAWLVSRPDVGNAMPVFFGIVGDVLIVYFASKGYCGGCF